MRYFLVITGLFNFSFTLLPQKFSDAKSKRYYILILMICIFLNSCGYRHVIGYSEKKLPESQVALLLIMLPKETEKKFKLNRYPLMYGFQKIDNQTFGLLQQSAEVLPGKHDIRIECNVRSTERSYGSNYEVWTFSSAEFNITTAANEVYYLHNDRTKKGIGSLRFVKLPIKYTDLKRIDANFKEPGFDLK